MGNTPIPFSFPSLSIPPIGSFLSGIFFVALVIAIIFSAILLYHWVRYGKHALKIGFVTTIYFAGIILFLGMMLFSM